MKCIHVGQVKHTYPVTLCQQHTGFSAGIVLTAIHINPMSVSPTTSPAVESRTYLYTLTLRISPLYSPRQAYMHFMSLKCLLEFSIAGSDYDYTLTSTVQFEAELKISF